MKAYGFKRKDKITCRYGCCGLKGLKQINGAEIIKRGRKKTARQNDAQKIFSELIENQED